MAEGKVSRAELAEAVRALTEEVARLRAEQLAHLGYGHGCHCGHSCLIVNTPPPLPQPSWVQPYRVTCGDNTTASPGTIGISPYPTTSVASGGPAPGFMAVPGAGITGGGGSSGGWVSYGSGSGAGISVSAGCGAGGSVSYASGGGSGSGVN